jgi:hypothetical protein
MAAKVIVASGSPTKARRRPGESAMVRRGKDRQEARTLGHGGRSQDNVGRSWNTVACTHQSYA